MERKISAVSNVSSNSSGFNLSFQLSLLKSLNHNMTMAVLPVTVFIGMETFIGFIGNILILVIYVRCRDKSNFRYYVISMACIDLTSCITTLPMEIFSQLNWYTYRYDSICKGKSFFNVFTAWASASILFLLAFDRHRKVRQPLQWQILPSFAIKTCITSIFLSAIVAIPAAILWGKQTYGKDLKGTMVNVSICEKDEAYADDLYPLIYIGAVYAFPVTIMMFIVCTLNIITSKAVFCAQSESTLPAVDLSNVSPKPRCQSIAATESLSTGMETDHEMKLPTSDYDLDITKHVKYEIHSSSPRFCRLGFGSVTTNNSGASTGSRRKLRHTCEKMSLNNRVSKQTKRYTNGFRIRGSRPKQKMVIMLVLTLTFVVTMMSYVILSSFVAKQNSILNQLQNSQKAVFFFFWRLYFINTVVNPILYGFMDPRFRSGLIAIFKRNTLSS